MALSYDPSTHEIDITNLVENLRQAFVKWAVLFVMTSAVSVPWLSWLSLPVISQLFNFALTQVLDCVSKGLEMQGFFLNTAMRKSSQAGGFISAVNAKNALPPTASQEDFENAEKNQMLAFSNLVRFTV